VSLIEVHGRGRPGQYQVVLGPLSPMEAIDQLVFVHDTLKTVFASHGYFITMLQTPVKYDENGGENIVHLCQNIHLYLSEVSSDQEEKFFAGILNRLPALCAFCVPHEKYYERIRELTDSPADWGLPRRLMPMRKIKSCHWGIGCIDTTANIYLTLAVILAAGCLGVSKSEPLVWPDFALHDNKDLPRKKRLPQHLEKALFALESGSNDLTGDFTRHFMYGPMIDHYVKIKRHEISLFCDDELYDEQRELLVMNL